MSTKITQQRKGIVLKILPEDNAKLEISFPQQGIADLETNYTGPSPYHLDYCGYEPCYPGYRFGPYRRSSFLLHLVEHGSGIYQTEKQQYRVHAGQIFLIYPGELTTYYANEVDPWSYYWIGFSGYQCDYILSRMGFSRTSHVITVSDTETLTQCVDNMLQARKNTFDMELKRTAQLLTFFSEVIKNNPAYTPAKVNQKELYAEMTLRYISNHFDEKIKIADIADRIGLDRSYLSQCFRDVYHIPPQEYLVRLRMQKAADLLACTGEPVSSIALSCGYTDHIAFRKAFKSRFGMGPGEYREHADTAAGDLP